MNPFKSIHDDSTSNEEYSQMSAIDENASLRNQIMQMHKEMYLNKKEISLLERQMSLLKEEKLRLWYENKLLLLELNTLKERVHEVSKLIFDERFLPETMTF